MDPKVLLVDDDRNVLEAFRRSLRGRFQVATAQGGEQALGTLEREGPFTVVVADMRMPGMDGVELLVRIRERAPDTIRIMLTGDLDPSTATASVNQGQVFRFLTKPCEIQDLILAIEAGVRQHQLLRAEKDLLEQTLTGCVQTLSELLSGVDPEAFNQAQTVKGMVRPLAEALHLEGIWEIEVAALLAPIGRLTLPPELQAKFKFGAPLQPAESLLLEKVPELGAAILEGIPRLEPVAGILRWQAKGFDGSGFPPNPVRGAEIPEGSRLIRLLSDFVVLKRARRSRVVALEELRLRRARYDPAMLEALVHVLGLQEAVPPPPVELPVEKLRQGMVLAGDILTAEGRCVLVQGTRLGPSHLRLLRNLEELLNLAAPIAVESDWPSKVLRELE